MERLTCEPRLEPPAPVVVYTCSECGEPIYEGDRALHLTGWGWICENCVRRYTKDVTVD